MSATTITPQLTLDVSGTKPVPFSRLVKVELRKMYDTRAGMWLLISTAAVSALVMLIQVWVGAAQNLDLTFRSFLIGMNTPMGVLLPVLGVMSVTSEWGQRTAMVTFTQTPVRSRVIGAKLASALAIAAVAVVVGFTLAAIANLIFAGVSGESAVWGFSAALFAKGYLLHAIGMLTGFAFGTLFLNTAAAIVIYFVYSFVLPGLFEIGASLMGWFESLRPWIDFAQAQQPLIEPHVSGSQWAHLLVSGLIWLALPFVLGLWRVLRAEVK
jgi:ABC-2 type transport system permease protein